MTMQPKSLNSTGPTCPSSETCESSRQPVTSPSMSSAGGSHVRTSAKQMSLLVLDSMEAAADCGQSTCELFSPSDQRQSSLRTRTSSGESGCQWCGGNCPKSGTRVCRWASTPLYLGRSTAAKGRSSWPTPTATANQLSPSMRKHPACRRLQDAIGRTGGNPHPQLWEWLMGLPEQWTDLDAQATPSSPK